MKNALTYLLFAFTVFSCKKGKPTIQEEPFPTSISNGKQHLNLTKSPYYPTQNRPVEEMEVPYGTIEIDSTGKYKMIIAKVWSKDDSFKKLAQKENIQYVKRFYLDTTNEQRKPRYNDGFELKNISNDTAYFKLKTENLSISTKNLEEKWSMAILYHFEKDGIPYDTTFLATFKSSWIKK